LNSGEGDTSSETLGRVVNGVVKSASRGVAIKSSALAAEVQSTGGKAIIKTLAGSFGQGNSISLTIVDSVVLD